METMELIKNKKWEHIQLGIIALIFLIFLFNIFLDLPGVLFYVLILAIIGNLVFGVINKRKNIFLNIVFLILALLLFIFLVGYFATILGAILGLIYLVMYIIAFFKKE